MGMSLAPLTGMRCQFCQQPISLLRRLSDPKFCSARHREQYEQQEATLAIARLQPIARQAGGRGRATHEFTAAVAVLVPVEVEKAVTLADAVPCPPHQTRQYWCFAFPAEPIASPVEVMLGETPARWLKLAPPWATSVASIWPVNRQSRPDLEAPTSPVQVFFALPASPLQPLPWIAPGTEAIPGALASLIPLGILPAWSLPNRKPAVSGMEAFRCNLLHPAIVSLAPPALATAPALTLAPLRSVTPPLSILAISVLTVSIEGQRWGMRAGSAPLGGDAVRREWQSYLQRMERQLIVLAEQAGLCAPVASSSPSARIVRSESRGTAGALPFEVRRLLPSEVGTFSAAAIHWGRVVPLPGPVPQSVEILPGAADELPLAAVPRLAWPQQPIQPARSLPQKELVAWVSIPHALGTIQLAPYAAEPKNGVTYCWPAPRPSVPALPLTGRMIKLPAPAALSARAALHEPSPLAATPAISFLLPLTALGGSATELSALFRLNPPAPRIPTDPVGAELHPHAARPSVIVPPSAGAELTRSSARHLTLFPLTHLFPTRRDRAAQVSPLNSCPWVGKPVLPPTRLPRISLQERNATRANALREVRQVLQKQTIDRARRFWKLAPADLKWLALALPLILGVWVWPKKAISVTVPSPVGFVKASAKAAAGSSYLEKAFQTNLNLGGFEERIASRSSIHLDEDFSAGLGLWDGDGNWARSWYYDRSGVVRPGRMAIYQPSIPMVDYQLVLTAAVERRSISWMVRASSLRNYVAARLNISGSGGEQRLSFERWTVKDGRVTRRQTLPLSTTLGTATTARIRMEVVGNTFTTLLQDQVIDVFSDSSHASGGVGLFSSDGDQPRIYRLELTHQHDFFGKLCSFLAPHPITKAGTIRP